MPEGLNRCTLIGNLGADPELKHTQSNQAVLRIRLATTERFATRSGERSERTEWHTVIVWGRRAEALSSIIVKGDRICVEGSIQYRQWEDRDGNKRTTTEIRASHIVLLGGRDGKRQSSPRSSGGYGGGFPADDFGDDDIPF